MSNNICKAITISGERCKLRAGVSDYCHIHDPEKIAKREAFRQVTTERNQNLALPKFSERKGFKLVSDTLQVQGINNDLRNSIWNVLNSFILERYHSRYLFLDGRPDHFTLSLWIDFFKRPVHLIPTTPAKALATIYDYFSKCEWYEVYDFLEFTLNYSRAKDFHQAVNEVLARELSGYRFIGNVITDVTDEQEIKLLEDVLADKNFPSVKSHLQRALELMSDRENPDYRNSIKESISAVESFAQIVTGDPNATLGKALSKLEHSGSHIKIHSALKSAFSSLYGYTSNEGGIRHAMLDEPNLSVADAKFFLLACTSFINYMKAKL